MSKNKLMKAGLGYTIGNYLLKGLAFFSIPVFTRLMSTEDYGLFNTFAAYESISFVLIGLALHSCIKNAKYRFAETFDDFLSTCMTLMMMSFVFWLMLLKLFEDVIQVKLRLSGLESHLLVVCSMGNALVTFYTTYQGLEYRYKSFLAASSMNAVLNLVLSVVLMKTVFIDNPYLGRVFGTCIPLVLLSVFVILYFYRKSPPKLSKIYADYALKISIPIIPHGISQVVLSQFDRIMIRTLSGASQAGLYSFAYNIYMIIQVTASSLNNVWEPWFFEKMNGDDHSSIKKYATLYSTFIMWMSSSVLIVSPELIKLLAAKTYWDSIYVVVPIVIAGYFSFLYTIPVAVEYYYEKTKYIALATGSAALINIVLNAAFIPCYGYIAAAYTTLVTYMLYFMFHYILSVKLYKRSILEARILLINILFVFGAGIFTLMELNSFVIRWGSLLVIYLVTFGVLEKKFHFIRRGMKILERRKDL
ncbi:MAG: oligosaccharide flippase family protein [Hungatella sp.]|nr:oligosaccharide flippase family protein [Hungatella sp.]